jgi:peptidoglycan hydrolase-like protein with peptidoglycan-binding domain
VALAWFAIAAEFERQTSRNGESALARRRYSVRRRCSASDAGRAHRPGSSAKRVQQIVEALQPPKQPTSSAPTAEAAAAVPPPQPDPPGWPEAATDQVRVIQQALVELKFLRDKPDGIIGPVTRGAIRTFQRSVGAPETGEATKEVFAALQETIARRDAATAARTEPKPEASKPEAKVEPPKPEPATTAPAKVDATPEPKPEAKTESPKVEPKPPAVAAIDLGKTEPPPAPPTSAEFARLAAKAEPKVEPPKVEAKAEPSRPAQTADRRPSISASRAARRDVSRLRTPASTPELKAEPPNSKAKIEAPEVEPAKVEPVRTEPVKAEPAKVDLTKVNPPKPPMPKIETAKPAATPVAAVSELPKIELPTPEPAKSAPTTTIDLGKPDPPSTPTSADVAPRGAWPTATADRWRDRACCARSTSSPRLLRTVPPRNGDPDYERTVGLRRPARAKGMFGRRNARPERRSRVVSSAETSVPAWRHQAGRSILITTGGSGVS